MDDTDEVKRVCRRFRSSFLSPGSSLPAAEAFRRFRGRDPSHEPLLLHLGLKEINKPKQKGAKGDSRQEEEQGQKDHLGQQT